MRIGQIRFSRDNEYLFYLAQRGDDKHTSLYKIPVNGGESTRVYQHETSKLVASTFAQQVATLHLQRGKKARKRAPS